MNLFQIDFLGKMATLLKEAFKFKKYRAMNPALAVFTGIFMLPLVAISFLITAILALLCFAFAVLSAPVKYLHGIVNNEGKEVKHATQAIVYLISWPMVFALYLAMSALLVAILPVYAALSITLYAWSVGGFKFHLFPHTQDDISIETSYHFPPAAMIVASFSFFLIPATHAGIKYFNLWLKYLEGTFMKEFSTCLLIYVIGYVVYMALYAGIGFTLHAKAKKKMNSIEVPEEDAK